MTSHLRVTQRVRDTKRSDDVSSMAAVMTARVTELQSDVDAMKGVVDKLPAVTWGLDKNAFTQLKQELDKLVLIDKVSSFVFSHTHTRTHTHARTHTHTHAHTHTHTHNH
jgi:hypothetical protein